MKYKTRGMISPQGLSRVYFCAHPNEQCKFDEIADSILKLQNCSVWHEDEEVDNIEEHFLFLGQIQLFVMPVSSTLLLTENFALEKEFSFAMKNHIPVLPLMQEPGLENIFNQKCGNLQFLDKNTVDSTAISYEEKFEKFLASVLTGEEQTKKIREAFEGYIFLSYRKKDRKYAQELMRMIHKNEFCRNMAIWYDEFLVPGEDFNDAICDALQKSTYFVLTVTPNLVNETNYVMTEEYPLAVREKKTILPVEMVPTNQMKLKWNYKKIPKCVKTQSEVADAFRQLKESAVTGKAHSPEHNFLLGLAYLSGIDVEVDYEYAVKLITESAKAGVLDAVSKLVEMYHIGLGVARDYKAAIEWQEEKILLLKQEYEKEPTVRTLEMVWSGVSTCGELCKESGSLLKALYQYEKCVNYMENSLYANDKYVMRDICVCYNCMGDIYKKQGDIEECEKNYRRAFEIMKQLVEEEADIQFIWGYMVCHYQLGDLLMEKNDLTGAKKYYESGVELVCRVMEEKNLPGLRSDYALGLRKFYKIAIKQSDYTNAKEYIRKSLTVTEQLVEETHSEHERILLADDYRQLGNILKQQGEIGEAKVYYEKACNMEEQLVKEQKSIKACESLLMSYQLLGEAERKLGRFSEAINYCEKAIALGEQMAKEVVHSSELYQKISATYGCLGDALGQAGKLSEAKNCYAKAVYTAEMHMDKNVTKDSMNNLAISYHKLSLLAPENRNEGYHKRAIEIMEELCRKYPLDEEYKKRLAAFKR